MSSALTPRMASDLGRPDRISAEKDQGSDSGTPETPPKGQQIDKASILVRLDKTDLSGGFGQFYLHLSRLHPGADVSPREMMTSFF